MPFRIDPKKPFDDEIRRAGLELIDDAITILRDRPSGPHEAVHDARKRFKRLRALYRLVARGAPDFSREENARFRDIARSLAFARDATALVETADYLEPFALSDAQGKALRPSRRCCASAAITPSNMRQASTTPFRRPSPDARRDARG